jgi:hypothetical protein
MTILGATPWREEERGTGVTQVVGAPVGQAGRRHDRLEAARHRDAVHRGAQRRGEDQVPGVVVPARPGEEVFPALASPVFAQCVEGQGRCRHDPMARDRIGLDEFEPAVHPLEGMTHPDRGGCEVDVAPSQSQDLALAKPDTERGRRVANDAITC